MYSFVSQAKFLSESMEEIMWQEFKKIWNRLNGQKIQDDKVLDFLIGRGGKYYLNYSLEVVFKGFLVFSAEFTFRRNASVEIMGVNW